MENRIECALKPSRHACDQGRTNDASNDVVLQPTQDSAARRVGSCLLLTPVGIYRPPAAAFSHRSVPERKVLCRHSTPNACGRRTFFIQRYTGGPKLLQTV